jgi:hypothetical protein
MPCYSDLQFHLDLLLRPVEHLDAVEVRRERVVVGLDGERERVRLRQDDRDRDGVVEPGARVKRADAVLLAVDVHERVSGCGGR